MKVLIKQAIISSQLYGTQPHDILIENGFITSVENKIDTSADKIVEKENLHVSIGWMDCFANFADPGEEFKETLESGANAAAAGGFTEVMLIPNTIPVVHNKSQVEYLLQKSKHFPVTIHPIAAITKDAHGKELNEIYDMQTSGAVAFSDGVNSLQSSGMMIKALQYVLPFNGVIIQLPDDKNISANGLINEGIISTRAGLPGMPAIAEELMIARDIELVKYTNSKIHFTGISTKKSLQLIAKAKRDGLQVTCSVAPYHLYFADEDVAGYDTNLKVNPPLRTKEDMTALREGIKNGEIDFIASHHLPHEWDSKTCEFEYAKNGMEGLESVFGVAGIAGISSNDFIKMQTENIRKIFNLPMPEIKPDQKANLTLYNPDEEYIFSKSDIRSKSFNNAFIDKKLKGKAIGIINGDKIYLS